MNEIIHKIKGYLGYKVPLWVSHEHVVEHLITNLDDYFKIDFAELMTDMKDELIKLELRRLDSLTKKEAQYINDELDLGAYNELAVIDYIKQNYDVLSIAIIEYLNSIHIDYQNLIVQGLAFDINESNVQNMHKGE